MRPKVLLLEEDATFASELQGALRGLGCEVTLVREGHQGLARAVSERFDLILLSAELKGMNGFRVCNRIKKDPTAKSVPVFLMGATSSDEFKVHEQLATRAETYFQKPVLAQELIARMRMFVPVLAKDVLSARELAAASETLDALVMLRAKIAEQEETCTKLARELAETRAAAVRSPPTPPKPAHLPLPAREVLEAARLRQSLEEKIVRLRQAVTQAEEARDQARADARAEQDLREALEWTLSAVPEGDDATRATKRDLEERLKAEQERAAAAEKLVDEMRIEVALLGREQEDRLDEANYASIRIAALEALVASRTEEAERLALKSEDSARELPALEAEIVVLRSELTSVRRQLDQEILTTHATAAQLEQNRLLLSRAKAALAEGGGPAEEDGGAR